MSNLAVTLGGEQETRLAEKRLKEIRRQRQRRRPRDTAPSYPTSFYREADWHIGAGDYGAQQPQPPPPGQGWGDLAPAGAQGPPPFETGWGTPVVQPLEPHALGWGAPKPPPAVVSQHPDSKVAPREYSNRPGWLPPSQEARTGGRFDRISKSVSNKKAALHISGYFRGLEEFLMTHLCPYADVQPEHGDQNVRSPSGSGAIKDLMVFNTGSFSDGDESMVELAQWRLAIAMVLKDLLQLRGLIYVYDRRLTTMDCELLSSLVIAVADFEPGWFPLQHKTLVWLPDPSLQLIEDLLNSNWGIWELSAVSLLCPSIQHRLLPSAGPESAQKMALIAPYCIEAALPVPRDTPSALKTNIPNIGSPSSRRYSPEIAFAAALSCLQDVSVHTFPLAILFQLDLSFWGMPEFTDEQSLRETTATFSGDDVWSDTSAMQSQQRTPPIDATNPEGPEGINASPKASMTAAMSRMSLQPLLRSLSSSNSRGWGKPDQVAQVNPQQQHGWNETPITSIPPAFNSMLPGDEYLPRQPWVAGQQWQELLPQQKQHWSHIHIDPLQTFPSTSETFQSAQTQWNPTASASGDYQTAPPQTEASVSTPHEEYPHGRGRGGKRSRGGGKRHWQADWRGTRPPRQPRPGDH